MAEDCGNVIDDKNIDNIKRSVRISFARLYATVKARELKTLRQLDAIAKQCQNDKDCERNCVQNIHISYENESTLIDDINNFGVIDLEKLNLIGSSFLLEDYVSPNDDHMYSYKCIEQLPADDGDLEAIEEAALRQVTSTTDCVCYVNVRAEQVSKQFREVGIPYPDKKACDPNVSICEDFQSRFHNECLVEPGVIIETASMEEVKKIDPTDDWLNSIKTQTEIEPIQVSDVMEHSTIVCT